MTRVKYIYQQTVHKTNDFLLKDIDIDNRIYSENSDYLKVFSLAPGSMLTSLQTMKMNKGMSMH